MSASPLSEIGFQVNSEVYPSEFLKLIAFQEFYDGRYPIMLTCSLDSVATNVKDIKPPEMDFVRSFTASKSYTAVYKSSSCVLLIDCVAGGKGSFYVTSFSSDQAESLLKWVQTNLKDTGEQKPEDVSIGFWHNSVSGPSRSTADINAPFWSDIKTNYATSVVSNLEKVINTTPENVSGRLLLLHGVPGTGKSSFFRSLARAWEDWCSLDVVLDPEAMFGQADYLIKATMHDRGEFWDDDEGRYIKDDKWRLLLLEDCDELISASAKSATGQGLARLLNLTDGIFGKGRKSIIAITTNEDVNKFHPAVTRPGRCLANIEVPALAQPQAQEWLGDRGKATGAMTLAELYAMISGESDFTVKTDLTPNIGQYL